MESNRFKTTVITHTGLRHVNRGEESSEMGVVDISIGKRVLEMQSDVRKKSARWMPDPPPKPWTDSLEKKIGAFRRSFFAQGDFWEKRKSGFVRGWQRTLTRSRPELASQPAQRRSGGKDR